jgi:hypothetical protein
MSGIGFVTSLHYPADTLTPIPFRLELETANPCRIWEGAGCVRCIGCGDLKITTVARLDLQIKIGGKKS